MPRISENAVGDGVSLPPVQYTRKVLTYGPTLVIDGNTGDFFSVTITDAAAITIAAPLNVPAGKQIIVTIRNASGGAHGAITWNAAFKMAALAAIATGFSKTITFVSDGTNLIEMFKSAADVPN